VPTTGTYATPHGKKSEDLADIAGCLVAASRRGEKATASGPRPGCPWQSVILQASLQSTVVTAETRVLVALPVQILAHHELFLFLAKYSCLKLQNPALVFLHPADLNL